MYSDRYIVAPSSNDKHAKNAVVGQYLQGTMTLAKVFNILRMYLKLDSNSDSNNMS